MTIRLTSALLFLAAAAFALHCAACGGGGDGSTAVVVPKVIPSSTIEIDQPLTHKGYPVLVSNPSSDAKVKILSLQLEDQAARPLATTEIGGVRYFRHQTAEADYYFRLGLDGDVLIVQQQGAIVNPDASASIEAADVSKGLCNSAEMAAELKAPNWCDILATDMLLDGKLVTGHDGFALVGARDGALSPLLVDNDATYADFAQREGIHVCGATAALTRADVRHRDPFESANIYADDDSGAIDEGKLLAFCEATTGVWDSEKLSLALSSLAFAELPLRITAWAEPTGSSSQIPSLTFFLAVGYQGGEQPVRVAVRVAAAAAGDPLASLTVGQPPVFALKALELDGRQSYSPLGGEREPLQYFWTVTATAAAVMPVPVVPFGENPLSAQSITGGWTDIGHADAWLPLVGDYTVTLKVRDTEGLESEEQSAQVTAGAQGRAYVQLWWDKEEADMALALVRFRSHGSYAVPPAGDDVINPPGGTVCQNSQGCVISGDQYFCSAVPGGQKKCTYHPDAAHNDTCFTGNPNPGWGDAQNPDDDPTLVGEWPSPGPRAIAISRPAAGVFRVVIKLLPTSPRTITKSSPVNAHLSVILKGVAYEKVFPLYFRPASEATPDIPILKAADVNWPASGEPELEWVELRDQDCYIPGQCPYANPQNAVVDTPFDPEDPNQPRSIWCDEAGDPDCVE